MCDAATAINCFVLADKASSENISLLNSVNAPCMSGASFFRFPTSRVEPDLTKELQADVVVIGTVTRTGVAGLLIGNAAEAILAQLRSSVLAVKPPGFISPVKLFR